MPLYRGNKKIVGIYKGTTKITNVYKGTTRYFSSGFPSNLRKVSYVEYQYAGIGFGQAGGTPLSNDYNIEFKCACYERTGSSLQSYFQSTPSIQFSWTSSRNYRFNVFGFNIFEHITLGVPFKVHTTTTDLISGRRDVYVDNVYKGAGSGVIFTVFGSISRYAKTRMYYYKITNGTDYKLWLVPCVNLNDGTCGLYDMVSGVYQACPDGSTHGAFILDDLLPDDSEPKQVKWICEKVEGNFSVPLGKTITTKLASGFEVSYYLEDFDFSGLAHYFNSGLNIDFSISSRATYRIQYYKGTAISVDYPQEAIGDVIVKGNYNEYYINNESYEWATTKGATFSSINISCQVKEHYCLFKEKNKIIAYILPFKSNQTSSNANVGYIDIVSKRFARTLYPLENIGDEVE